MDMPDDSVKVVATRTKEERPGSLSSCLSDPKCFLTGYLNMTSQDMALRACTQLYACMLAHLSTSEHPGNYALLGKHHWDLPLVQDLSRSRSKARSKMFYVFDESCLPAGDRGCTVDCA
eukprot:298344-Pelagomonas_calceolata.AAC.11